MKLSSPLPTDPFSSLPDEALLRILQYMPPLDLINLLQVSKVFSRVGTDYSLWQTEFPLSVRKTYSSPPDWFEIWRQGMIKLPSLMRRLVFQRRITASGKFFTLTDAQNIIKYGQDKLAVLHSDQDPGEILKEILNQKIHSDNYIMVHKSNIWRLMNLDARISLKTRFVLQHKILLHGIIDPWFLLGRLFNLFTEQMIFGFIQQRTQREAREMHFFSSLCGLLYDKYEEEPAITRVKFGEKLIAVLLSDPNLARDPTQLGQVDFQIEESVNQRYQSLLVSHR